MSEPQPGFRIKYIHAFTAIGPDDEEGVIGFMGTEGWLPMVAADEKRVEMLRPIAQQVARTTGAKVTLARFSVREDLEVLE